MSLPVSRRSALGSGLLTATTLSLPTLSRSIAQEPAKSLAPLNRFPRIVQDWYVAQVKAIDEANRKRWASLATRADAEKYVAEVRTKIATSFGTFPGKTPLNARVTGRLDRDTYVVEKVIFESRPGFLVTANLYLPKNAKGPCPGVVGSCGHSNAGKADPNYQAFSQGLALQGYVVLIFDPIGQGERVQYAHLPKPGRPNVGVEEHLLAGNQQFLIGEFFGSWRAWDGIRALDYLLTRPEVDPKHVGITGNSGGGTMTTWLAGLDRRWTMAAPSCFVTTFLRNLENELPADTEQCPPRAIALGLDHVDFLAAMVPRPVIILAKEKDFFDIRGSEEAYRRLKSLYRLLGAEDQVKLHIGPTGHGYSIENREAMYRWFNRCTGNPAEGSEPKLTIDKEADLWCSPKGTVAEQSKSVFAITRDRVAASRPEALSPAELKKAVTDILKVTPRTEAPEYRILRPISGRKYPLPHATSYAPETEPGMAVVVSRLGKEAHYARPGRSTGPAILYVSHLSADRELREEKWLAELLTKEPEATIYACDVRGVGESLADTCGNTPIQSAYGSDYFYAIHGLMLDRPYLGQKTGDLLGVIAWVAAQGHGSLHLVGQGFGTLPASFAALLDDRVTRVTLRQALRSYRELATTERYRWPLSTMLPGVIGRFDLPDVYGALASKKIQQLDPCPADRRPGEAS